MKLGLGTNTIRKHLGNVAEFLRYLRGRGYAVRQLSLEGFRPPKLKPSDIRTLTDKPCPERLRPMFQLPVFTGCLVADNQHVAGDQIFHSANYDVPMLLTYLGARRTEFTGLAVKEVVETANGCAIHIRINQFRRVKNTQSLRMPPPPSLLKLGSFCLMSRWGLTAGWLPPATVLELLTSGRGGHSRCRAGAVVLAPLHQGPHRTSIRVAQCALGDGQPRAKAYAAAANPASNAATMRFTSLPSMTSGGERMILLPETRTMTPSL